MKVFRAIRGSVLKAIKKRACHALCDTGVQACVKDEDPVRRQS